MANTTLGELLDRAAERMAEWVAENRRLGVNPRKVRKEIKEEKKQ